MNLAGDFANWVPSSVLRDAALVEVQTASDPTPNSSPSPPDLRTGARTPTVADPPSALRHAPLGQQAYAPLWVASPSAEEASLPPREQSYTPPAMSDDGSDDLSLPSPPLLAGFGGAATRMPVGTPGLSASADDVFGAIWLANGPPHHQHLPETRGEPEPHFSGTTPGTPAERLSTDARSRVASTPTAFGASSRVLSFGVGEAGSGFEAQRGGGAHAFGPRPAETPAAEVASATNADAVPLLCHVADDGRGAGSRRGPEALRTAGRRRPSRLKTAPSPGRRPAVLFGNERTPLRPTKSRPCQSTFRLLASGVSRRHSRRGHSSQGKSTPQPKSTPTKPRSTPQPKSAPAKPRSTPKRQKRRATSRRPFKGPCSSSPSTLIRANNLMVNATVPIPTLARDPPGVCPRGSFRITLASPKQNTQPRDEMVQETKARLSKTMNRYIHMCSVVLREGTTSAGDIVEPLTRPSPEEAQELERIPLYLLALRSFGFATSIHENSIMETFKLLFCLCLGIAADRALFHLPFLRLANACRSLCAAVRVLHAKICFGTRPTGCVRVGREPQQHLDEIERHSRTLITLFNRFLDHEAQLPVDSIERAVSRMLAVGNDEAEAIAAASDAMELTRTLAGVFAFIQWAGCKIAAKLRHPENSLPLACAMWTRYKFLRQCALSSELGNNLASLLQQEFDEQSKIPELEGLKPRQLMMLDLCDSVARVSRAQLAPGVPYEGVAHAASIGLESCEPRAVGASLPL